VSPVAFAVGASGASTFSSVPLQIITRSDSDPWSESELTDTRVQVDRSVPCRIGFLKDTRLELNGAECRSGWPNAPSGPGCAGVPVQLGRGFGRCERECHVG